VTSQPLKVLCSFHYHRANETEAFTRSDIPTLVMGDSGAFSAANAGASVQYAEYTQWVRRWRSVLFSYPVLDVIGNAEATWDNYRRMKRDGLHPLPVYHFRTPITYLKKYLEAGERYIALGGMVGNTGKDSKQWLIRCFKEAEPYGAVFHGFGRTRMDDLRDFPWYSVDSTSWNGPVRYRDFQVFDGTRTITLNRNEPKKLYTHGRLLRDHGITPQQMDRRHPRSTLAGYTLGFACWRRVEEWLRARHGPVPGPAPTDPPGPHLFLASKPQHAPHLLAAYRNHPGPYFPPRNPPTQEASQ
jgi:hypothetical protein